ncbi:MAG: hypothetical protein ACREHG_06830 [Candidatus Saccharimonadales bacterium]
MPNLKIAVGINSLSVSQYAAYTNHLQFFFRLGRSSNTDLILVNPSRMSIDKMRNMTAQVALDNNCDFVLFLDDDVIVPTDGLDKLLMTGADICAGDVIIRGYPFEHMAFRYVEANQLSPIKDWDSNSMDAIEEVDAVGFSFCLISTKLIRKVEAPYFVTGPYNTEDIYFCIKARKAFPNCSIAVRKDVKCGHILWSEIITPDNHKLYAEYWKSQNQVLDAPKPDPKPLKAQEFSTTYEDVVLADMYDQKSH